MTDIERKLYDLHVKNEELLSIKLDLMSKMLDSNTIQRIVLSREWNGLYIYGGANLGIQAYYAFREFLPIRGIVDRAGKTKISVTGVNVLVPSDLEAVKDNDPIIITPIEYSAEITSSISEYVGRERIFLLNELF